MTLAAPIIFLILFTGGAIAILEKTGALDGLIYHVINKFRNQQLLFICIVAALFLFSERLALSLIQLSVLSPSVSSLHAH